jgi:hypothetical protein
MNKDLVREHETHFRKRRRVCRVARMREVLVEVWRTMWHNS